ncbi:MAG: ABC-2 type transport system ATP-binding protein [Planctomycetota bacterium]|jgi:ABC-2 type transport system ATP-binding protein
MIEIRNLSKHFGSLKAVDDVSFKVDRGEVLGFLGPNGAGKSTTMKMITGFLAPSRGTAIVCGNDVRKKPQKVKAKIGYLPEGAPLYPDMTPLGLLKFIGEIRGLKGAAASARIDEVVAQVQLESVLNQRIETLSKGFKRRVGLAQAILHDPEVLILDEPTDGLDPNQKHQVRQLIRSMSDDKVIILSTHILEEVEMVCSRAIIIANGAMCFDGTPMSLRKKSRYYNAVVLGLKTSSAQGARAALSRLDGVEFVEETGTEGEMSNFMVYPRDGQTLVQGVSDLAHQSGWEVEHLHVEQGRLDDVFRDITGGRAELHPHVPERTELAPDPDVTEPAPLDVS